MARGNVTNFHFLFAISSTLTPEKNEYKIHQKLFKKWKENMIFLSLFLLGLTIDMQERQTFEILNPFLHRFRF